MKFGEKLRRRLRRATHTIVTIGVVVLILAANLLVTFLGQRRNWFIDLTASVSDATLHGMGIEFINKAVEREWYDHRYSTLPALYRALEDRGGGDVTILFCTDPDILYANDLTRPVYIMALDLQKHFDFIHVKTVNVALNPSAVDRYRTTSATTITWKTVIFTVPNGEYRLYSASRFFAADTSSGSEVGMMAEIEFATAILSLTADDLPKVCFATGHGETVPVYNDEETGEFYRMITGLGFTVATVDLDRETIPDDCYLLILNGTSRDYDSVNFVDISYISPIEKIERHLASFGSVMYFRDSSAGTLPHLEEMLAEWGIAVGTDVVRDVEHCASGEPGRVIASYAADDTLGFAMYEDIASLATPPVAIVEEANPIRLLWGDGHTSHYSNNAVRSTSPVLLSSGVARTYNAEGLVTGGSGDYVLVAVAREESIVDNTDFYAYLFVSGTDALTASEYFAGTYANYDVMNHVIFGMARENLTVDGLEADRYKQYTGSTENITGMTASRRRGAVVLDVVLPIVLAGVCGTYVVVRRRRR